MTEFDSTAKGVARREAIRRVGLMLGGVAFVGGTGLLEACAKERSAPVADSTGTGTAAKGTGAVGAFSVEDQAFLDEIADTILPTTAASPGAKAAATGRFMAVMVTDCYDANDQRIFTDGMKALEAACQKMHNTAFMKATPEQRTAVLTALDTEAIAYMKAKKPDDRAHYFRMMKELAMLGFFTSEIGYTQAMRYKESPGPFQGCVPYKKGEKAWAAHA